LEGRVVLTGKARGSRLMGWNWFSIREGEHGVRPYRT
jgi:hypothetical protein